MGVSISVEEPSVDLTVRGYEKFVEATGISAPVAASTAGVSKGQRVTATGIAAAVNAAVASTDKGTAVSAQTAVAGVSAPIAAVDKGTRVGANGQSAPVSASEGAVRKGEAVGASGMTAPASMGEASVSHLKPDHRWPLSGQPPNLLTTPENLTGADWQGNFTHNGFQPNVGPNGESANDISAGSSPGAEKVSQNLSGQQGTFSVGAFVRAKSGTHDVSPYLRDGSINLSFGDRDDLNGVTVGTEWTWVSGTAEISDLQRGGFATHDNAELYVLRVGLNRGTELDYSTQTGEPQVFEEVMQGADVQNGTSSGADTNDLKTRALGGVTSDEDDKTGKLPASVIGDGTWAFRYYVEDIENGRTILGDPWGQGKRWGYQINSKFEAVKILTTYEDGTNDAFKISSPVYDQWNTAWVTIKDDGQRILVNRNGTQIADLDLNGTLADQPMPLVGGRGMKEGAKLSHVEKHPVLTRAEAEAVRQRLAGAPQDPIPPTERWDLSAETSPHNLLTQSETLDSADWTKSNTTVTADMTTNPEDGTTDADALIEDSNDTTHYAAQLLGSLPAGAIYAFPVWLQDNGRTWAKVELNGPAFDMNPEAWVDLSGNAIGTTNGVGAADLTEVGGGWHRAWIVATTDNADTAEARIYTADADGSDSYVGDGSSGLYVWGVQVARGDEQPPPYASTGSSIAFPQIVPAQRNSANDLTLSADWIAPKGLAGDKQRVASRRPIATWVGAVQATNARVWGRSANGWTVTDTALVAEDEQGNTVSGAHGLSLTGGARHQIAVVIDTIGQTARLYADTTLAPATTLDLSQIDALKSGGVELLPDGGTVYDAEVYTRALSDEEALYARQRIRDNPDSRVPILN